jgi:hypothetical protein
MQIEGFEGDVFEDERGTWWTHRNGGRVPTTVTKPSDPAYQLMLNPNIHSEPDMDVFRDNCYICVDPEFALMGLPLCRQCPECKGHIAADDVTCENGHDEEYLHYLATRDEV